MRPLLEAHLAQGSYKLLCRAGPCSSKDGTNCIAVPHKLHLHGNKQLVWQA
jgi:hypothetical protein